MMDFDRVRSRFKLASAQLEQDPVELFEKQAGLGAWVVKKLEESEAPSAYVGQAAQLSGLPEEDVRSYVRNIRPHRFGVPAEQFAKDIKPVWAMKAEKYNPLHQKLTATAAGSPEEAAFLKQHGKSLDNHHNAWVGGQSDLRKKYTGGDSIGMWANPEKLKVKTSAVFGGGGFDGGMPQMPAMSVAGNMGGAKFVGFTGRGGRGRRVGSDAGASMVARHQADMMMAGMMQQNEFGKAYANALGRMSRGGGRVKLNAAGAIPGGKTLARGMGKNIKSSLGGVIDSARAGIKQDAGEIIDRARAGVKNDMSDLIGGDLAKQRGGAVGLGLGGLGLATYGVGRMMGGGQQKAASALPTEGKVRMAAFFDELQKIASS